MAKKPAKPNFASFTKAELIKTIRTLDRRQTQLLNQIAKLQSELQTERDGGMVAKLDAIVRQRKAHHHTGAGGSDAYPWEK